MGQSKMAAKNCPWAPFPIGHSSPLPYLLELLESLLEIMTWNELIRNLSECSLQERLIIIAKMFAMLRDANNMIHPKCQMQCFWHFWHFCNIGMQMRNFTVMQKTQWNFTGQCEDVAMCFVLECRYPWKGHEGKRAHVTSSKKSTRNIGFRPLLLGRSYFTNK